MGNMTRKMAVYGGALLALYLTNKLEPNLREMVPLYGKMFMDIPVVSGLAGATVGGLLDRIIPREERTLSQRLYQQRN